MNVSELSGDTFYHSLFLPEAGNEFVERARDLLDSGVTSNVNVTCLQTDPNAFFMMANGPSVVQPLCLLILD